MTQLSSVGKQTVFCERTGISAKNVEFHISTDWQLFSQAVFPSAHSAIEAAQVIVRECSNMSFVFNFYQYGDAATTPPRPRPKTAARPLPALLPPGDWSEPTRRRRRDDPANAGGRRGRSHSPRHRRRRHSRSPRRRVAPSPRRSRSGSAPRPKTLSPSAPPGNFNPPGTFHAPRPPPFFREPQVFVPPPGHQQPRAPMPPGHPWPQPPWQQFRPTPELSLQLLADTKARTARPAQHKGPRRPAVPKTPPQQKTVDELLDNLLRAQAEERRPSRFILSQISRCFGQCSQPCGG